MRWARPTTATATPSAVAIPRPRATEQDVRALSTPARAERALDALRAGGGEGALWFVTRVSDGDWTPLAGRAPGGPAPIGTAYPWESTLCSTMLPTGPGERAVARADLAVRPYDLAWQTAERWGMRSYVGAALRGPYGEVVGTVCRVSVEPLEVDPHLVVAFGDRAAALERTLANDLRRVEVARQLDAEDAQRADDPLTHLPGRVAWGLLLEREEERARALAEPGGVVVVDTGHLRTVRGMRRVVGAVAEVVGDAGTTCRLGPRQLGVLCAGRTTAQVERLGAALHGQLVDDGRGGAAGWASRRGRLSLQDAWERAEGALTTARRAAAGLASATDDADAVQLPATGQVDVRPVGSRTSVG